MEKLPERIRFHVLYTPEFTEDIYNRLGEWCKKNNDRDKRGYNDTYKGLIDNGYYVFDNWGLNQCVHDPNTKIGFGYGVDNNIQGCEKKLSISEVLKLLGEKEEFKVGDWVIGWHVPHLGLDVKPWKIGRITNTQFIPDGRPTFGTSKESVRPALPVEIPQEEIEYWEKINGSDSDSFTEGKIYKIRNNKNIEQEGNFKDDKGIDNGYSPLNHKHFKPSTRAAYEEQEREYKTGEFTVKIENKVSQLNTNKNEQQENNTSKSSNETSCKEGKIIEIQGSDFGITSHPAIRGKGINHPNVKISVGNGSVCVKGRVIEG